MKKLIFGLAMLASSVCEAAFKTDNLITSSVTFQGDSSVQTTAGISISSVSANFLTKSSATATYLTQSSATLTYQPVGSYLTTSSATATYLTQSSATATYIPWASSATIGGLSFPSRIYSDSGNDIIHSSGTGTLFISKFAEPLDTFNRTGSEIYLQPDFLNIGIYDNSFLQAPYMSMQSGYGVNEGTINLVSYKTTTQNLNLYGPTDDNNYLSMNNLGGGNLFYMDLSSATFHMPVYVSTIVWSDGSISTSSVGGIGGGSGSSIYPATSTASFPYGALFSTITTTGDVNIGASTYTARLAVQGAGLTTGRTFTTSNSSGVEKFTILDNGKVGIGLTPDVRLNVYDSVSNAQLLH